ncbi:MAG TPA: hypothetical protein VIG26_02670 [Methyloceanibacter sp.]
MTMTITPPVVSGIACAILIVMQMVLMIAVVFARRRNKQSLGELEILAAVFIVGRISHAVGLSTPQTVGRFRTMAVQRRPSPVSRWV